MQQDWARMVADGMVASGIEELTLPHLVITCDVPTGVVTYSGPYPDGIQAIAAADAERCRQARSDPDWPVTITVAPLLEPADEGHHPDCRDDRCTAGDLHGVE